MAPADMLRGYHSNGRMPAMELRKTQSHGRIGEAAVTAKCWMHGIPAYNTGGLRANFAGSDLLIDTADPRRKLLVQVKTGYAPPGEFVYFTQCAGEHELGAAKFVADFLVLVNIDRRIGPKHDHDGSLGFEHLTFFVLPREAANRLYREALIREHQRPLLTGGQRKLGNLAVNVEAAKMEEYRDAWHLLQAAAGRTMLAE